MKDYLANDIRNVVLLGHSGAGKSSLVEAALYSTKVIERMGKAGESALFVDYDAEEVKRALSVYTAIAPIEWRNCKINFIDTPGYLDYEGEMRAGLAVGDNALVVVSAKDGIEAGTEKAVKLASKKKLPTIFFINKIDEENASFDDTYEALRQRFGKAVIAFELPMIENGKVLGSINILRNKAWFYDDLSTPKEVPTAYQDIVEERYNQIAEAIAMTDDSLMEKFFSGERFNEDEVAKGLRIGVRSGDILPVYCGSATMLIGIERLLDLISEYFPNYAEKGTIVASDAKGEDVVLETNETESFTAQIFKTVVDPFVGKISYLKVMSGVLTSDSTVYNLAKDQVEKVNQIYVMNGKYQVAVGKLFTGDLGALVKLQYSETNDTLSTKDHPVSYSAIEFPQPMLGMAIKPKTKADEDKMSFGLQRVLEEDRSLRLVKDPETKEQILYAMGDQAFDVVCNKLKNKYKVEIEMGPYKVPYRETIKGTVEAEGKHKKQSGGAGQYGHVWLRFEPTDSEEMVFAEEIFGGAVPKQYFPAVEQGLRECMEKGVLAGYKVVGVKATLYDGSYHDVDSKEIAFKVAARLAYKAGMPKAKPILLEPIGKVTVLVPEEYTGTIIGDFNKRRGIIMGMEMTEDNEQKIEAEVPMAEMQKYATELRSMTQGRGQYFISFDRYEPCPQMVADKVIKSAKVEEDDE